MGLRAVHIRLLEAQIETPIRLSFGAMSQRRMMLIEVESSDGTVGYGECWVNHPPWVGQERVATLQRGIAPLLLGESVADVEQVADMLWNRLAPMARQWGAPGPIWQAISGVEMALWDLLGKQRGVSIAELLGGRDRERIPVYASGVDALVLPDLEQILVATGISNVKCRVGVGHREDIALVEATAAVTGSRARLYADANQAWTWNEATETLGEIGHLLAWIEEPLEGNELAQLERLAEETGVGVAMGENLYGMEAFGAAVASEAIHVVQPDVSKAGGVRLTSRVCELASALGTPVMPHAYSGAVALAATLQIASALPAVTELEFDVRENPFLDQIVVGGFGVVDGFMRVPAGPGLGIELDQRVLDHHTVQKVSA